MFSYPNSKTGNCISISTKLGDEYNRLFCPVARPNFPIKLMSISFDSSLVTMTQVLPKLGGVYIEDHYLFCNF